MEHRTIRERLILIFKQYKKFNPDDYYYFLNKTNNNIFLRSIFSSLEIKLSFLEESNKKYAKESYLDTSIVILNYQSIHEKRKKEEVLRTFFFFEKLISEDYLSFNDTIEILDGNLSKILNKVKLETKRELFSFYKIVEKEYLFKLPLLKTKKEVEKEVEKIENLLHSYFNEKISLRYKGPFKWFFKKALVPLGQIALYNYFKNYPGLLV